jgi:hypothetical protein
VSMVRRTALVLVAGLVFLEVSGRLTLERIASDRIAAEGVAGGIDVVVGTAWWRPAVLPALMGADLDRIHVRLRDAEVLALPVRVADYVLDEVDVAISLPGRRIGATGLGAGEFRLLVDPSTIGDALGLDASIKDGRLVLGEQSRPAELMLDGDDVVVAGAALEGRGGSETIRLVDPLFMPCRPKVRIVLGVVELRCTAERIPGILEQPLGPGEEPVAPEGPEPPVELQPPATAVLDPRSGEAGGD